MARITETTKVLHALGWKEFGRRVWHQANEDDVFVWAASLAYSWIFALFPFLIFILTLAPLMPANARAEVKSDIDGSLKVLSPAAAAPIKQQVNLVLNQPRSGLLSIGLLVTVWVASGGMSMTMQALDRCYDIKQGRSFLVQRFVAILLTIIGATLVILVMVLMPIASGIIGWMDLHTRILGPVLLLLNLFRYAFAILLMLALLALVYRWGVSIKLKFHFFTPGAIFSLAVWLILAFSFRAYIDRYGAASYNKTYGAVAGVAILLLFFYIDATVLLIGAEINSEVDFAMLGLPSFSDVEVHRFERPQTEEHRELLAELKKKRDPAAAPMAGTTAPPARTPPAVDAVSPAAQRRAKRNAARAIGLLATAGSAWAFFKALREARQAWFEKARLKELYPETYHALFESDAPAVESPLDPS
jgi:membrane protein